MERAEEEFLTVTRTWSELSLLLSLPAVHTSYKSGSHRTRLLLDSFKISPSPLLSSFRTVSPDLEALESKAVPCYSTWYNNHCCGRGGQQQMRKWRHHVAHLKPTLGSGQAELKQPVLCGKRNLKVIKFGSQLIDFCVVSVTLYIVPFRLFVTRNLLVERQTWFLRSRTPMWSR